jgi:drug/metabolite transporter (DMT)-like permease
MILSLLLAVAASALMAAGLVVMKQRAEVLPPARGAGSVRAVIAWVSDVRWLASIAIQALGYALYVIALAGAPVSMVAVMMQGGIALFVLFAVAFLHERARPREWAGIAAIAIAMVMLALSLPAGEAQGNPDAPALIALTLALLAAGFVPMASTQMRRGGAAAAIFSGVAFGLGSLYTKGMTDLFIAGSGAGMALRIAANPFVYAAIAANIAGLVMLQNAFHDARAIIVMPLSSALSNVVPIAGGMMAFGEALPTDTAAAAMRIGAFALTIAAGALLAGSQELPAARAGAAPIRPKEAAAGRP